MSSYVDVPESSNVEKGGVTVAAARPGGTKKGLAIMDFILRLGAIAAAISAAAIMGTADQTLPFFTQFFQFEASYDSFPTFEFFLISMAIVGAYLVLSLPFSVVTIIRPHADGARLLLLILDTVFLTLATSSAAASAGIVYLAHNAVVAAFAAVVILALTVVMSGVALRSR
ncbi:hypothetical protein K1719_028603 [Acacia pycnantha]|nr:hypothetical protein K1719_028603 [Acacia pycnantha]